MKTVEERNEEQYQKLYTANFNRAYLTASIMPDFMESVLNMSELFEPVQQGIYDGIKQRLADIPKTLEEMPPYTLARENGYHLGCTIAQFAPEFIPMLDKLMPEKDSPVIEGITQGIRHYLEDKIKAFDPALSRDGQSPEGLDRISQPQKDKDQDLDR